MHLFTILYVKSPAASVAFYEKLLGEAPIESHPTFASFRLPDGHMLGLWGEAGVEPKPLGTGARVELCFDVPDRKSLEARLEAWTAVGATLIQDLAKMDFGDTFTVADPDGHRLRVMVSMAG
jgi:catechol 2,3-dioxygenase-like lactoylglutathione lyase family enzyme